MNIDGMIAGIEDGLFYHNLIPWQFEESAWESFHGDLRAAEELHQSMIPQWEYIVRRNSVEVYKPEPTYGTEYVAIAIIKATSTSTARAWLIALLRAKQSEMEE